jgi:hypothetical protein
MSMLFLLNEAINTNDINLFKEGMFGLIYIQKKPSHSFLKHESIYSLPILYEHIFTHMHGQEEQEIYRFIEQMAPYQGAYIDNEVKATAYCQSEFNGFLGILFTGINIVITKQINNNPKYRQWCFNYSPDKKSLLETTDILPDNKDKHFANHHGKRELTEFWKTIKHCPYIISARSTHFGGNEFIREINEDGTIEIVLQNTARKYAIHIQTTGNDQLETTAIAVILKNEYER